LPFKVNVSDRARTELESLEGDSGLAKRLNAVRKALARLEASPRHPGLQSHKYGSMTGPQGEDVFESYAEQSTPAAYRVFWYYGPGKGVITIVAVTRHP
jgi:hypothetical protein